MNKLIEFYVKGKYKECPKCHDKGNARIAEHCDKCGYEYTKDEIAVDRYEGIVGKVYWLNDFYNTITFGNITGTWIWRLGTLLVIIAIAFFSFTFKDSKLSIKENDSYTYEYNKDLEQYMVTSNEEVINLSLYMPKATETLLVEYYDFKDNLMDTKEYKKNENIKVDTLNNLNYYKIVDKDNNDNNIVVYTFYSK